MFSRREFNGIALASFSLPFLGRIKPVPKNFGFDSYEIDWGDLNIAYYNDFEILDSNIEHTKIKTTYRRFIYFPQEIEVSVTKGKIIHTFKEFNIFNKEQAETTQSIEGTKFPYFEDKEIIGPIAKWFKDSDFYSIEVLLKNNRKIALSSITYVG